MQKHNNTLQLINVSVQVDFQAGAVDFHIILVLVEHITEDR